MSLSRREFLKIMGGSAAVLAFPGIFLKGCRRALEEASERTAVIWLQGQSCSGCSVSLLNKLNPDIVNVITEVISLNYHQTLMTATGHKSIDVIEDAVNKQRRDFVLIVEGSIPLKDDYYCTLGEIDGRHVSIREWVEKLGKNAASIVSMGSCSAFGGIPAAKSMTSGINPTGAVPVSELLTDRLVINVPGCPPHPDWMVGTLMHLLLKGLPSLDVYNRPVMYFGETVHDRCEWLHDYRRGKFANEWGEKGCLYNLGCLGMDTGCDIPVRKWNNGANSCTGSGAGCIGCTEKVFPDYGKRGLFYHLQGQVQQQDAVANKFTLNKKSFIKG